MEMVSDASPSAAYRMPPPIIKYMNAVLVQKALALVVNPQVLVNMISQRVRQLNSGAGGRCRPMLAEVGHLSVTDVALLEIIEGKMSFELDALQQVTRPSGKNRRRPQQWARAA
jgi:DNA-directed RNA polymerase subunit omega